MLSRGRIEFLNGSVLTASEPATDERDDQKASADAVAQCDDDDSGRGSILLSDVPRGTKEDTLIMFLENRRRCAGGPIKSLHYDQSRLTAAVTFQDKRSEFSDCVTSWVVLCHPGTHALGGSLGGGSFVVKVDIDRNRISADDNTTRYDR